MDVTLALLADGRFPSGGHAHSGGWEAAARHLEVFGIPGLEKFVSGRLHTVGLTEGALIAAGCERAGRGEPEWSELDQEANCRILSPTLRGVSRSLGRQWARAGRRIWGHPVFETLATIHEDGPHQVTAYAAVTRVAGLDMEQAVLVHLHHLVATCAGAAVRLHGLDPFAVQSVQVAMADDIERVAKQAAAMARTPLSELPAASAPLIDLTAEFHAADDMRLFQS